jgi:hypothetical protein
MNKRRAAIINEQSNTNAMSQEQMLTQFYAQSHREEGTNERQHESCINQLQQFPQYAQPEQQESNPSQFQHDDESFQQQDYMLADNSIF